MTRQVDSIPVVALFEECRTLNTIFVLPDMFKIPFPEAKKALESINLTEEKKDKGDEDLKQAAAQVSGKSPRLTDSLCKVLFPVEKELRTRDGLAHCIITKTNC